MPRTREGELTSLAEFSTYEKNWDGQGSIPISPQALETARKAQIEKLERELASLKGNRHG